MEYRLFGKQVEDVANNTISILTIQGNMQKDIKTMDEFSTTVKTGIEEQAKGLTEITSTMIDISNITNQYVKASEEINQSISNVSEIESSLIEQINFFKV